MDTTPQHEGRPRRRQRRGEAVAAGVLSAHQGENATVFAAALGLYVPAGSVVADVTYGRGAFWREVPPNAYELLATDLASGVDCRRLPYASASIDALVLDPPYMEGLLRSDAQIGAGAGSYTPFRARYSAGQTWETPPPRTFGIPTGYAAVLSLYVQAAQEAARVLKDGGVLLVKCQDAVSGGRQWLTHVLLINSLYRLGFAVRDLFVVVRRNRPGLSRVVAQRHARKNHSYLLVFVKDTHGTVAPWMSLIPAPPAHGPGWRW